MDLAEALARVEQLKQVIYFLACTVVFVVGCWMLEDNLPKFGTKPDDPYCPLHRVARSKCAAQHKDE